MLGLLQAYGSGDSDSDSDREQDDDDEVAEKDVVKLPNPFEAVSSLGSKASPLEKSVFVNPYVEAEHAKAALLEKHVKMTSRDVKTVNGKKICWNHKKNKCRFGHNCKYAHESDLVLPTKDISENLITSASSEPPLNWPEEEEEAAQQRGKKRPGLSATLVPSKKVMKIYNNQKQSRPK